MYTVPNFINITAVFAEQSFSSFGLHQIGPRVALRFSIAIHNMRSLFLCESHRKQLIDSMKTNTRKFGHSSGAVDFQSEPRSRRVFVKHINNFTEYELLELEWKLLCPTRGYGSHTRGLLMEFPCRNLSKSKLRKDFRMLDRTALQGCGKFDCPCNVRGNTCQIDFNGMSDAILRCSFRPP